MRSIKSLFSLLAASGVALASLAASANADDKVVRIGLQKSSTLATVLRTNGELEKRFAALGYKVTWSEFTSGLPLLEALNVGAIDQNELSKGQPRSDEFDQSAPKVIRAAFGGGVNRPWTLAAAAGIGVVLMFSRTFIVGNVELANAHHVIGSLVLAVVSIAAAEVARKMRYLVGVLGVLLIGAPLWYPDGVVPTALSAALGVALIALCIPRGPVRERYGTWVRMTE